MAIAAVTPEECIYIDDREVLVRAASKLGIQSWQHKTVDETREFLESL
jgi:putative hydrolase of the HAD superfamily